MIKSVATQGFATDSPAADDRPSRIVAQLALAASAGTVLAFVGFTALLAILLPYHAWDAMSYGYWSREIADAGYFHVHFPDLNDTYYQRPLLYVLQGWLWRTIGFHVGAGRLLSLAFTVLLIASVAAIARRTHLGWFAAAVAALVCIDIADLQQFAAAGLTDVPVAAMVALTVFLLWRPQTRATAVGLMVASALTGVSKSTGSIAIAGLAAGMLLGPRKRLRSRVLQTAPLALGLVAATAYFAYEAGRLGEPFLQFMRSGSVGYFGELASATRRNALLRMDFLGVDLRVVLWFAVLYSVFRIGRVPHASSALAAAGLAVAASWALPALSDDGRPLGPFADGIDVHALVFVAFAALLPFAALASRTVPEVVELARLLLLGIPITVIWLASAAYATRFTSPGWPAFILLITCVVTMIAEGARRAAPAFSVAPLVPLIVAALVAFPHIDAALAGSVAKPTSRSVWNGFWEAGPSGWVDAAQMRSLALGPLDEEVEAVRARLGPRDTVISSDDRLPFFFGRQVVQAYPAECSQLRGHRVFVLVLQPDTVTQMERQRRGSSRPQFWQSCRSPRLVAIREIPDAFAAFVVCKRMSDCDKQRRQEARRPAGT